MNSNRGVRFTVWGARSTRRGYRLMLSVLALLLALLAAGCNQVNMDAPPEIVYGRDICSRCGMIIEDARFAAAYMTTEGEPRIFDDIGDMLVHQLEKGEMVHVHWVHDYETEAWLRAEAAFFVQTTDIHTPMGYGLVALAEEGRATAVALRHNGRVFTFNEIQQETAMLKASHNHNHSGHSHP
jgi:copper chaperone NosL